MQMDQLSLVGFKPLLELCYIICLILIAIPFFSIGRSSIFAKKERGGFSKKEIMILLRRITCISKFF